MGTIAEPRPVKLFVGMLASKAERFVEAEGALVARFGPADLASEVMPFDTTDYYREEMGEGLLRKFVSFERLVRPDEIIEDKCATNGMEEEFARSLRAKGDVEKKGTVPLELSGGLSPFSVPFRPINLDPGYLSLSKVVLATTKDYSHRLYLGRGIFAEVTLHFHKGRYEPWDWTYPDYRTEAYGKFFLEVRRRLSEQLREAE